MKRAALAGVLAAALSACSVSNRLVANRTDYVLYRDTRTAPSLLARLRASDRYLREMPHGRFRAEVRAWFDRAEPRFFQDAHDRPSLLRAYLRAMPEGPHARAAADRLAEFELLNTYRARHEASNEAFLERVESEQAAAEAGRKRLLRTVSELTAELASIQTFGQPTSALDDRLIYTFRLEPPRGECNESHCAKTFRIEYAIPANKTLVQREAELVLSFDLEQGGVERAALEGPELFDRLAEAADRAPVRFDDFSARADAIARAVQLIGNSVDPQLPPGECQRPVVAPVVLARECRGVRFEVSAAMEAGGSDRLQIARVRSVPAKPEAARPRR